MLERLQKILAEAGLGSRRECERIITAGRVTVDGKRVTTLGTTADAGKSRICCDDLPIKKQRTIYYLLNKPKGFVCTNRDELGGSRQLIS